ncbi:MAG: hypothetical protein ACOYI3_00025 [Christensenellales bacterium]|jgi:ABC-type transport system involved in multi-copper enzyme maturation permease subunit
MTKKERLLAIFMLIALVLAVAALIVGTVNNNEPLVLSGFGVLVAVFLYSLYAKKRLDSAYYEEQAKRLAEKDGAEIPAGTSDEDSPNPGE